MILLLNLSSLLRSLPRNILFHLNSAAARLLSLLSQFQASVFIQASSITIVVFAGGEHRGGRVWAGAPAAGRTLLRRQLGAAASRPPVHPGHGLRARHRGHHRDGQPGELYMDHHKPPPPHMFCVVYTHAVNPPCCRATSSWRPTRAPGSWRWGKDAPMKSTRFTGRSVELRGLITAGIQPLAWLLDLQSGRKTLRPASLCLLQPRWHRLPGGLRRHYRRAE